MSLEKYNLEGSIEHLLTEAGFEEVMVTPQNSMKVHGKSKQRYFEEELQRLTQSILEAGKAGNNSLNSDTADNDIKLQEYRASQRTLAVLFRQAELEKVEISPETRDAIQLALADAPDTQTIKEQVAQKRKAGEAQAKPSELKRLETMQSAIVEDPSKVQVQTKVIQPKASSGGIQGGALNKAFLKQLEKDQQLLKPASQPQKPEENVIERVQNLLDKIPAGQTTGTIPSQQPVQKTEINEAPEEPDEEQSQNPVNPPEKTHEQEPEPDDDAPKLIDPLKIKSGQANSGKIPMVLGTKEPVAPSKTSFNLLGKDYRIMMSLSEDQDEEEKKEAEDEVKPDGVPDDYPEGEYDDDEFDEEYDEDSEGEPLTGPER